MTHPILTPADRLARAEEALARGFTSEAAKKEIQTYSVSTAYGEGVDRAIRDKLLSSDLDRNSESYRKLYWGIPTIANWKPKHATLFAAYPDEVAFAERCVDLRNRIKVAPLVAKAPTKKSIEEAARLAVAKTCQICGRPILAETGLIAHHGYQRPGNGFQTASCFGARELPFEVSRDCLGRYIEALTNGLDVMRLARKKAAAEKIAIQIEYVVRELPEGETRRWMAVDRTRYFSITRETLEVAKAENPKYFQGGDRSVRTFDDFKKRDLASRDGAIKAQVEYRKKQQARFDAWTPAT